MPSSTPSTEVVGAAIVDDLQAPTRLLAARRIEPEALAGYWELPGGKVEPDETHPTALRREIVEELGVRVDLGARIDGPLDGGRWQLSPRHVMTVWLAVVVDGDPHPIDEHDEVRWVDRDHVRDLHWLEGDGPIVEVVAAMLGAAPTAQASPRTTR